MTENSEKLARIKAVRAGNRGVITKLSKEAEWILNGSDTDEGRLKTISGILEDKLRLIKELDSQVLTLCNVTDIEAEIDEAEDVISRTLDVQRHIRDGITKKPACPEPALTVNSPTVANTSNTNENTGNNIQEIGENSNDLQASNNGLNSTTNTVVMGTSPAQLNSPSTLAQIRPKLPKLVLSRFKGNVTEWTGFWDSFKVAVHENPQLSEVDKFNYLHSLLEGSAARAIQGLTLTSDNYKSAVDILHERFGKMQRIITSHMDELLKIPSCTSDRASSLRYVYDKISIHVRGLASLGVSADQYGSLLIPIIMDKLPSDIKLQIARKATGEVWQIEELLKTIRIEVEAREASDASKIHKDNSGGHSHRAPKPPGTTNSLIANEGKIRCVYCNGEHYSASCESVVNAKERKDILRKSGRCFVCLKTNHVSRNCNSPRNCRHCNNKHHQSICERVHSPGANSEEKVKQDNDSNDGAAGLVNVTTTSTTHKCTNRRTVLLQTARAVAFNEKTNQSTSVRVLFDNGSQRSYVTDHVRSRLGLEATKKEKLKLNTFGETKYKSQDCDIVNLRLKKPGADESISIDALSYPVICSPLPSKINVDLPHLAGLELADDWEDSRGSIDILIGSDYNWSVVTGEVVQGSDGCGPAAVSSKLGWLLSGPINSTVGISATHSNLIVSSQSEVIRDSCNDDELTTTLRKFWDTETMGIHEVQDESESKPFMTDVKYDGTQYEVGLPWGEDRPGRHYDLCFHRLKALQRRLKKDAGLLTEYDNIIQEQLQNGIIERVVLPDSPTVADESNVHYMPHHGVVRKDKDTTKLRIVYDGSARQNSDDLSINDCLDQGPNFIPKLFDVLVKFRSHHVALTADIEKAFLMIGISESDRDMLRFLWFNEPDNLNSDISCFRFTRLVFGLRPSPAILGSIIACHLDSYKNIHPDLIKLIEDSLYVDDLISGAGNATKAFDVYQGSKSVLAEGKFNLRKWHSNSTELVDRIREAESSESNVMESQNEVKCKSIIEEDQTYTKATVGVDSRKKEDNVVKVLGVTWDCNSDKLCFDLSNVIDYARTLPATRRSLLKITAKIFDPLGFLSPFVVRLKCLFQLLCIENIGWDDALQGDALERWTSMTCEFEALNSVQVPRCYFDQDLRPVETQLHAFSDASCKAYAAVIYTRTTYENGKIQVRFVASKTRVAPMKKQTIPRLELLGATILARLVSTVAESLPRNIRIFYWVDSMTVLCWVKHDKVWKQYVSNRVEEIRRLTNREDWRYCPGLENLADIPSRGLSGSELATSQRWWNGPSFLLLPESEWPVCPTVANIDTEASVELVKNPPSVVHALTAPSEDTEIRSDISKVINCERFSKLSRLLRATAYVLRFIRNLKNRVRKTAPSEVLTEELTSEEVKDAESIWVKSVQLLTFSKEIQFIRDKHRCTQPVLVNQFSLFLDKQGILRSKGRINEATLPLSTKAPAMLPSKHWFTELVIRDTHDRVLHSGIRNTLATVRERFWIIRGREAVKTSLRHCVVCRKVEGQPYRPPNMPDLPNYRVSEDPPFSHTGLDFAGPLYVKASKQVKDSNKVWVLLLTCAATRAVHLELVRGLDVPTFLLAIRRFISRRGLPATLISDNAKTFKGAARELQRITRSQEVLRYLAGNHVTWKFIVDRAPWWGGFWERMVKTVKFSLKKAIGRSTVTYDELATILTEIESIINARPITYVYDDQESVSYALSPSHLIHGRMITTMPNSSHFEVVSTNSTLTRRAKHQRNVLRQLTKQWRQDYLLNLRENSSAKKKRSNDSTNPEIKEGDIVLLKSDSTARNFWQLAKIEELIVSRDGKVRAAIIVTINNQGKPSRLRRVVQHLIPLEIQANVRDYRKDTVVVEASSRLRRAAAVAGELRRRKNLRA